MSGEVEYYVGMRVIAQGREGTITQILSNGYDITFLDGQKALNILKTSVTPFETVSIAKQVGGPPPPPSYTPSAGAPIAGVGVNTTAQYQYPTAQQPQPVRQYQQQQPNVQQQQHAQPQQQQYVQPQQQQYGQQQPQQYVQQQQPGQQQYYAGVSAVPVVHGVFAAPMTVTSSPLQINNMQAAGNKLVGYEHSPDLGQRFSELCDCDQTCLMTCCCPCVVGGQVAQKLNLGSYGLICCGYITACIILLIIFILTQSAIPYLFLWLGWSIFIMMARMKVRSMWNIPGDSCDDCMISFCCTACSLSQVCWLY
jgi:Cys-rich protein (TIGR01571 family)